MLTISLYFVYCVIISCILSFNSRFTRIQIQIMPFLGLKKAELHCVDCKIAELGCHNTKVNMISILTPEGAPILPRINNFSHASSTPCKCVMDNF